MTTRKHRQKLADPLVTIDGPALKAALAARSLTVRAAARQLGVPAQTLGYVLSGRQRRVRLTLFKGLVNLLRGALSPMEFSGLLRGEAIAGVRRPSDMGDIELTADRAFRTAHQDAKEFWLAVLPGYPEQTTARVQFLYQPDGWRRALFNALDPAPPAEIDAAAEAVSRFWRIVFRPLLDGSAKVRPGAAQRLGAVAQRVFTGSIMEPRAWPPGQRPTKIVGPYAALRKPSRGNRSPRKKRR